MIEIRMSFATVGEAIGAARDLAAALGGIVPTSRPANVVDITEGFSFSGETSPAATPAPEPEAEVETVNETVDAEAGFVRKRRRRTKAEMEAARAAEAARQVDDVTLDAENEDRADSYDAEQVAIEEEAARGGTPEVWDDPAPAETPAEAAPVEAKVRTKDEADAFFRTVVRARVSDLMATIGQDAAKQYVEKFAKRISEIPAERYDEFVAGADAILSGAGA